MIEVPDMTDVARIMLCQSCPPKGQHALDRCGGVLSQDSEYDIDAAIALEQALAMADGDIDAAIELEHALAMEAGDASTGQAHATAANASELREVQQDPVLPAQPSPAVMEGESAVPEQPSQAVIEGDGSDGENAIAVAGVGLSPEIRQARLRIPGALSSADTYAQKWKGVLDACEELELNGIAVPQAASLSIVGCTTALFQTVQDAFPAESDMMKRIVVGALALYRMRLSDISLREHVHLLWIICGERQLRCHDGVVFYYEAALGYWEQFGGLLPQDTRS